MLSTRLAAALRFSLRIATLAPTCFSPALAQDPPARPAAAPTDANPYGRKYPARIYQTVRLEGTPPEIDGRLDDAAWKLGEWSGDFKQQIPTEGAAPSKPTELKILYDDQHVYIAIRAHDDPELVHRYSARRDDLIGDIVGVCFDSYNDKRTGFEFDLTAGGSKIDLILVQRRDRVGHDLGRRSGTARSAIDERGWTAEFRVPLNQLRYGPQDAAGLGSARLALDRPQPQKRSSGSSSRARTPGACTSSASCTASAGLPRRAPRRVAAARAGEGQLGPVRPRRRHRRLRLGRPRREGGAHVELHSRRYREPRLRAGGGGPVCRQPHRLRDVLRGEEAVLPRGAQDPELRDRGGRPALLLPAHWRPALRAPVPRSGRDREPP